MPSVDIRDENGTQYTDANGVPVRVMSSALPSGGATAARQDTGNTSLANILLAVDTVETLIASTNTKLDTVNTNVDGLEASLGAVADAAVTNPASSASVIAALKGLLSLIGTKAAGTAAAVSALIGGVYNATQPTLTTGQQAAAQLDSRGNFRTTVMGAESTTGAAVRSDGADGVSNTAINALHVAGFGMVFNGTTWDRLRGNTTGVNIATAGLSATATFPPAATSHVAGDANGAAGTFAFGAVSGTSIMITDAELLINSATAEATAWRLYLYNVTPPSAYADDAAWDLGSGDQASFLGYIDIGTAVDLGSTQWVEAHIVNKTVKLAGTSGFGYLVNLTTLTPAAVAHTVKLYAVQT